jgi:hypothetical protein
MRGLIKQAGGEHHHHPASPEFWAGKRRNLFEHVRE